MAQFLLDVPEDGLVHIASFLNAPDLLQFLSSHPRLVLLSKTASFWRTLITNATDNPLKTCDSFECAHAAKCAYLTKAYVQALPVIEWKPCRSSRLSPTGREGHLSCALGDHVIINGGFTEDEAVYILDTTNEEDWRKITPTEIKAWRHPELPPENNPQPHHAMGHPRAHFLDANNSGLDTVYGATLTTLTDRSAIRFGGFRGGGYTGECDQLALLTLTEGGGVTWQVIHALNRVAARAYHTANLIDDRYLVIIGGMASRGCMRNESILDTKTWTWLTDVPVTNEMRMPKPSFRHGHSVVFDERRNRMVLFGGGSGTDLLRSGRDNAEVWQLKMGEEWKNTKTPVEFQQSLPWDWTLVLMNEDSDDEESESSGDAEEDDEDHRQDMVARINNLNDIDRDRRAPGPQNLQNADDGSDDFQSARNGDDSDASEYASLPPLETRNGSAVYDEEEAPVAPRIPPNAQRNNANSNVTGPTRNPRKLTEAEKLCLGRCHMCFKVGPDTAMLAFGSGRPSTNRVLGFNLSSNRFFRPVMKGNILPQPRFTAAGTVFGKYNSYMLVHGGYCSQEGVAIGNLCVLDLAPSLQRDFTALPIDPNAVAADPVTEDDIRQPGFERHFGHGMGIGGMEHLLQNMFMDLAAAPRGPVGRRADLADMLGVLVGRGRPHVHLDDEDDDDDEEFDDLDDDEDDGPVDGAMHVPVLNMHWGAEDEEDEFDAFDDDEMSEVS